MESVHVLRSIFNPRPPIQFYWGNSSFPFFIISSIDPSYYKSRLDDQQRLLWEDQFETIFSLLSYSKIHLSSDSDSDSSSSDESNSHHVLPSFDSLHNTHAITLVSKNYINSPYLQDYFPNSLPRKFSKPMVLAKQLESLLYKFISPKESSSTESTKSSVTRSDSISKNSVGKFHFVETDPIRVQKSLFVGYACRIQSQDEIDQAFQQLLSDVPKLSSTTHNIRAGSFYHDQAIDEKTGQPRLQIYSHADGETGADKTLEYLLSVQNHANVFVNVARWYGGIKLGPKRFKIISQVARNAINLLEE